MRRRTSASLVVLDWLSLQVLIVCFIMSIVTLIAYACDKSQVLNPEIVQYPNNPYRNKDRKSVV